VAARSWRVKHPGTGFHFEPPAPLAADRRFLARRLRALLPAVVGMASVGRAQWVSAAFAGAWFILALNAPYSGWFRLALPVAAGAFIPVVVLTLPFNSPAFIVDFWTAVALFLLSAIVPAEFLRGARRTMQLPLPLEAREATTSKDRQPRKRPH